MEQTKYPLGLPEGSVRAIIGLTIILAAIISLLFSSSLNVSESNSAQLTSLAGVALGYYFGTRGSSTSTTQQTFGTKLK